MAISKVVYGSKTLIDLTNDTVTADKLASGYKAHSKSGASVTGTASLLNLTVVGGTAQPTSPEENTIWVNTSAEITSYELSSTQPSSPTEGMVWINTSNVSVLAMNVAAENTVIVYPYTCSQYVDGAWVSKAIRAYFNGAWSSAEQYLYNSGNEFSSLTGGFVAVGKKTKESYGGYATTPTITRASTYIQFVCSGTYPSGMCYLKNAIDLTPYNKLTVYGSGGGPVYVWTSIGTYQTSNVAASGSMGNPNSIDIASLSGKYYIGIAVNNSSASGSTTCTLTKLLLT